MKNRDCVIPVNGSPAAFAIGVQENSTGLTLPLEMKTGIMFAGAIGVGGPISFNFAMRGDSA